MLGRDDLNRSDPRPGLDNRLKDIGDKVDVPAEILGGLEKDEPARGFIIEQDREIAEKSGRAPLDIKSIARSGAKKK